MKLEDVRKIPWEVNPTPVSIVGTTFGNEIQTRILTNIRISNMLLFYLCTFETLRYFLVGN